MANESTKWLYEQLKGKGYNVGKDVNEFDSLMRSNADSRQWAYNTATKSGLNVGKDIDEFSSLVGGSSSSTPVENKGISTAPTVASSLRSDHNQDAGDQAEVDELFAGARSYREGYNPLARPLKKIPGFEVPDGMKKEEYKPELIDVTLPSDAMDAKVDGKNGSKPNPMQNRVRSIALQQGVDGTISGLHSAADKTGRMSHSMTQQGRDRSKLMRQAAKQMGVENTDPIGLLNPVSKSLPENNMNGNGKEGESDWENNVGGEESVASIHGADFYGMTRDADGKLVPQWQMPDGSITTSFSEADRSVTAARQERNRLDRLDNITIAGQLRRERRRLEDLKRRRKEIGYAAAKEAAANGVPYNLYGRSGFNAVASDPDADALGVAIRQSEERIKKLERQRDKEQGKDIGYWRTFGDVISDSRLWDMGVQDMKDALVRKKANDKTERGEGLNVSEQRMMESLHDNETTADVENFWSRAGAMSAEMIPFMIDFALMGGTRSGATAISKGLTSYMLKGTQKALPKVANNKVAQWTIKVLGTMPEDLLRSAVMTNTVQGMKTGADVIERKLGDVVKNDDGTFNFENDKSWGNAIWQGEANNIIEDYSEMFGPHLDGVLSLNTLGKIAGTFGAKRLSGILSKASNSELAGIAGTVQKHLNNLGVSDYFGEVGEEYYGQLWRTMLNLDDAYKQNQDGSRTNLFLDGQFHGDIWGGMALSMGIIGVGKYSVTAAAYSAMKHRVNKADTRASKSFTPEVWEGWRERIDGTTNDKFGELAEAIVADSTLNDEQKSAAFNYMETSLNLRGFNLASVAHQRGGEVSEEEGAVNESYLDGYSVTTPQEMNDAKREMELARQKFVNSTSEDYVAEHFDGEDALSNLSNLGNDEELRQTALDYVNSRAVYDGMIQKVRDDIDGKVEESNAIIQSRVNHDTGLIHSAVYGTDKRNVYVVSGTVSMYDDWGGPDTRKSSDTIIIRDAETGKAEFANPKQFVSINEGIDPEVEKEAARNQIIEEIAVPAANNIDGVLSFAPGDTYTILNPDGIPEEIEVLGNSKGEDGMPVPGMVDVQFPDGSIVYNYTHEQLQADVDKASAARVEEFDRERDEQRNAMMDVEPIKTTSTERMEEREDDGTFDKPANATEGTTTPTQPTDITTSPEGSVTEQERVGGTTTGGTATEEPQPSALLQVPTDEQGEPIYEQAEPDTAWDALVEQTDGDEGMANRVIEQTISEKEDELKKLSRQKPKAGLSTSQKIQAEKDKKKKMDGIQQSIDHWKRMAVTKQRRQAEKDAAREAEARRMAEERRAQEEQARAERDEAERIEREALEGVPDWSRDTPQDARARGYRRDGAGLARRQEPLVAFGRVNAPEGVADMEPTKTAPTQQAMEGISMPSEETETVGQPGKDGQTSGAVVGKEIEVKFGEKELPKGHAAVIDATALQPSHIQGRRNPLHFLDEAQPKERDDAASIDAARKIAQNIRPEEITSSVTAYTGAPTVNSRGETIQGNSRSDALRLMYESEPEQAVKYKQHLIDHATDYGLTPEQIEGLERPVLVNMLDVDDDEAIRLGQFVAQDTESGGIERIKPKNTVQRVGKGMTNFANILLRSTNEEDSVSQLIDANGVEALKWMAARGHISQTQYQSAFDSKGNITEEAKNDLKGMLYENVFTGGSTQLGEMFQRMPAKAQRAILATAHRDHDSARNDSMREELQQSIIAFNDMANYPDVANATNLESAMRGAETWSRQYAFDEVTGESHLPSEKFSNFALRLAAIYKGGSQKFIQQTFNDLFDAIQGTAEDTLFEEADKTPKSLGEAIKKVLKLEYQPIKQNYNGHNGSDALGIDIAQGETGRPGSTGDASSGERDPGGTESSDSGGGTSKDSGEGNELAAIEAEEDAIRSRIEVKDDDWAEGEGYAPTLKRTVVVDGKHNVTQVDAPNKKGAYTGSAYEYDGKTFGDLREVVSYIDNASSGTGGRIAEVRKEVNTEPTEAQKEAGNYKKGHVTIGGMRISIENPRDSVRRGKDADGKEWETKMTLDYGYIRGTTGKDKDHIDIFLSDVATDAAHLEEMGIDSVYVIDQYNKDGSFDEHKVVYGVADSWQAKEAYLENYSPDWAEGRRIDVTETSMDAFKKWAFDGKRKMKPFAEYKAHRTTTPEGVVTEQGRDGEMEPAKTVSIEQTREKESSGGYSITPSKYTNKKGKTSDVWHVKFDRELGKEEKAALNAFIRKPLAEGRKTPRGWYDRDEGTYVMRSEEAARGLGNLIGNEEAVADAQPLTADDYAAAFEATARDLEPGKEEHDREVAEMHAETEPTAAMTEAEQSASEQGLSAGIEAAPGDGSAQKPETRKKKNDLNTKGETRLSDHAEPVAPAEKPAETGKEREEAERKLKQKSHDGYSIGDEVLWDRYGNGKWEKVKIEDFEADGSPIFEAVKGVMSEKGDWSRVKPADGIVSPDDKPANATGEFGATVSLGDKPAGATGKVATTGQAADVTTKGNGKESRKNDVTLKAEEPVGGLFADLNDKPLNTKENVRNSNGNTAGDSRAEDGAQLGGTDNGEGNVGGGGRPDGGTDSGLAGESGGTVIPGKRNDGKDSEGGDASVSGAGSGGKVYGGTPGVAGNPSGIRDIGGSGDDRGDGVHGGTRGGSERGGDAKNDGGRVHKTGRVTNEGASQSVRTDADAAIAEFKSVLDDSFKSSIDSLSDLLSAGAKAGYAFLRKGICDFSNWMREMRKLVGTAFRASGFTDAEVDEWIRGMWDSDYTIDGETRKISEWASTIGHKALRARGRDTLEAKRKAQVEAERIRVKVCDRGNIGETLPFLLPQQQDDVMKAETQFFDESHSDREHAYGKGYMFTNGTGTGKTYTGLGIVKRFLKQGKGRILILTPSQTKVKDWIKDASNIQIDLRSLDEIAKDKGGTATTEKGTGAVVTTYANFRQNVTLLEDDFDLIVYDESHRLLENRKGESSSGTMQHYMLSNRNEDYAFERLRRINPVVKELKKREDEFNRDYDAIVKRAEEEEGTDNVFHLKVSGKVPPFASEEWNAGDESRFPELAAKLKEIRRLRKEYEEVEQPKIKEAAKKAVPKTKVVFLSATPFNTRENLDYAEGYIFSYPKEDSNVRQNPRSRFYLEHFGSAYKFRYNRLESSSTNPQAVARQEIEFSDYLQNTLQTMSGRVIDSEWDYSRDFPTVTGDYAQRFNEAMEELQRDESTRAGASAVMRDHNYISALFESLKVNQIIPRLKEHIAAGRKVVVFHRRVATRNELPLPFEYIFRSARSAAKEESDEHKRKAMLAGIRKLENKYADMLEWERNLDLRMPREQLAEAFGEDNVLFFSGKETSANKNKAVEEFNDDNSGKNLIVIQEASGKEGISLHDRTGKHQRVLVTLALPQSPITALQIEGRIFRIGNRSNAIFEYPLLGLNAEMILFGQTFNSQVGTTENLALGSKARNLRESIARGVEERSGEVDLQSQGTGGKEMDAGSREEIDDFERSVLDYYSNQKLSGRRDSREGKDYYPTPEPLGYMMAQWGMIEEGESVLEPSAGHGAIARYVPTSAQLTAIEPSSALFSRLQIKVGGIGRKFENDIFEHYHIVNKHDVVLMNPPFGTGGKLAVEHLAKAFNHLEEGGRIVALIPRGGADKRFDKWYGETESAVMTGEVLLPDITFEKAGTAVSCRVVVIDKVTNKKLARTAAAVREQVDLSEDYAKIEDFFEDMRRIEMPPRMIDTAGIMKKKSKASARDIREIKGVKEVAIEDSRIVVRGQRGFRVSLNWDELKGEYLEKSLRDQFERFTRLRERAEEREADMAAGVYEELRRLAAKLMEKSVEELEMEGTTSPEGSVTERGRDQGMEGDSGIRYREGDGIEEAGDRIEKLFEEAVAGNLKGKPVEIGRLTEAGRDYLEKLSGLSFKENVSFVLNPSDLMHIYKGHFGKNEKDKGQNIPLDKEDIRNIAGVISNPDKVIYLKEGEGLHRNMFYFFKEADSGTYNLMEIYSDRKGNLTAKTFYKTRKDATQRVMDIKKSLLPTSETYFGAILSDDAKLPKFFELSTDREAESLERAGVGAYSDADVSIENDPWSKAWGESIRTKRKQREFAEKERGRMRERAKSLSSILGLDIEVIEDSSTLKGKKQRAKGWYDTKTGKITVVVSNHNSASDMEATILHEAVAHHGLRQLLGKHFDEFLDKVYDAAENGIKEKIDLLASRNGWNRRVATEEYLAGLAERTDFEGAESRTGGWFNKIKQLFIEMLFKAGFKHIKPGSIGDNELRYILWRSYQNMAHPGRYRAFEWEAEDIAMQYSLKVGEYADSPADKPADAADSDVRFRDGDFTPRDRALAAQQYERMLSRGSWQFREATQDSMLGLKTLYKSILGSNIRIEDVAGYENAYLYENRMSSANNGEQHEYFGRYMKPLLESVGKLCGSKELDRRILTDYMMAKHGLERNEYMRKEAKQWNKELAKAHKKNERLTESYRKENRDFAGLCGLTGEKDWQEAERVAQEMVNDYEADHNTSELWGSVKKATTATLEKIYLSGLISEDTYNKVRGMYDFYIPLRGWDETTSDEVYGYLTSKDGPLNGNVFKHAEGRESKADDPIATIAMMADDAIRQGNRNIMKQRFLNFVHGNPSDLVSVNEMWLQHNDVTDEWEPVFANLQPDMTHEEIESEIAKFEAKMEALRASEPDKYKKGRDARNIPYKVEHDNLKEHQVLVKRNGRTYVMTINGNPRAAQALNGLTNPDTDSSGVISALSSVGTRINRELSAFYTTRNPNFVVSNFMRDMLYSNTMVWVKENPRYALQFHKNCLKFSPVSPRRTVRLRKEITPIKGIKGRGFIGKDSIYSIGMLLRKWENGTLNMTDKYEAMFKEFMQNGGETGYTSVKDIERHKKTVAAELRKQGSVGRKAWSALGMQLDLLNRSVENCARFAAFVTSREMGRGLDRSIYDAKEISVNFNKKGSGGKFFGKKGQTFVGNVGSALGWFGRGAFAFWNAGIQGMTNFGRAGMHNPRKALGGAAALFTLGCVIPLLTQMFGGDGDDDDKNAYYNLPEYVRRSNICFRAGDQWITIPLPIEYRAIYGMGELACGVLSGNERYGDAELARQIAAQVSQTLPIDMLEGGGGISPFIPTMAKPVTEAYLMNKSWTGLPIYKEKTPFNKYDPEWKRVYENTDPHLVGFAKWLNETSGGNDYRKGTIDINPAKIEYLLKGYFGGVYSFPKQLYNTGEIISGSRRFDWRDIPLANRVVKTGDERTAYRKLQNEYYKYKEEAEKTEHAFMGYGKDAEKGILGAAERADFIYNSDEFVRYQIFDEFEPALEALRKLSSEGSEKEKEQYKTEYYGMMREFVEAWRNPKEFMKEEGSNRQNR